MTTTNQYLGVKVKTDDGDEDSVCLPDHVGVPGHGPVLGAEAASVGDRGEALSLEENLQIIIIIIINIIIPILFEE